jgi:hypothetical protein
VLNAIVVWNAEYLALATEALARRGRPVPDAAWRHLTPLLWEHVHLVGRYSFAEPVTTGAFRPLRTGSR